MSRMGALGAIGGAAGGLSKFLSEEMAQKRAMTLEQQRTENRRETNRMNNEMRHELSLAELKARGEQGKDLAIFEHDLKTQNQPQFEDSEFNGLPGQRNTQTGEFKPLTGQGNYRPASKIQEAEYLKSMGVSDEQVRSYMLGDKPDANVVWREEPVPGGLLEETQKVPYRVVGDESGGVSLQPIPIDSTPNAPRTFGEAMDKAMEKWGGTRSEEEIRKAVLRKFPQFAQ